MHQTDPCQHHPFSSLLRILVLLTALVLTLTVLVTRPGTTSDEKFDTILSKTSVCSSLRFLVFRVGCLEWNHTSQLHLEDLRLDSQRWNRISALSAHACARSKQVQFPPQVSPARQDLGPHLDRLTGSTAAGSHEIQGHLKKTGTQDADSIPSQVQMIKMLDVPFYCGLLANNAMLACPLGSKKTLVALAPADMQSGFIAKQVPHLLDSYPRRKQHVFELSFCRPEY